MRDPSRPADGGPAIPGDHLTLADLAVGERAVLDRARLDHARARRLAELGLRPGARVTVTARTAGGGRIVAVDHARIALDRATLRQLPARHRDRAEQG